MLNRDIAVARAPRHLTRRQQVTGVGYGGLHFRTDVSQAIH